MGIGLGLVFCGLSLGLGLVGCGLGLGLVGCGLGLGLGFVSCGLGLGLVGLWPRNIPALNTIMALNPDKSEAIWLSAHQRSRSLKPYPPINVDVAGADVPISNKIKTLDIILDNRLTFDSHVASICAACLTSTFVLFDTFGPISRKTWQSRSQSLYYCNSILLTS